MGLERRAVWWSAPAGLTFLSRSDEATLSVVRPALVMILVSTVAPVALRLLEMDHSGSSAPTESEPIEVLSIMPPAADLKGVAGPGVCF